MADEAGIKITGIDEVLAALDELPAKIVKEHLAKALVAASVPVFHAIQAETPRLTGDLAEHLETTVRLSADGKGGSASIGFKGDAAHIARWVEYGFHLTGHLPKKEFIKDIPPKPFLRIAAETSQTEAVSAFTESLRESLGNKS